MDAGARFFFSKDAASLDEWEEAFIRFYEPYREQIKEAAAIEPALMSQLDALQDVTRARARTSGQLRTALDEMAKESVNQMEKVARAVGIKN